MPYTVIMGNIIDTGAEVIVNAANIWLKQGRGVCGAIFQTADTVALKEQCKAAGLCLPGRAVATGAPGIKGCRYIIHAVGPVFAFQVFRKLDAEKLRRTYLSALTLAEELNCKSVALPLISSGNYGCPEKLSLTIAEECAAEFNRRCDMEIMIVRYHGN